MTEDVLGTHHQVGGKWCDVLASQPANKSIINKHQIAVDESHVLAMLGGIMLWNTALQSRTLNLREWRKERLGAILNSKVVRLGFESRCAGVMGDSDGSPVCRDDYYVVDGLRLVRGFHGADMGCALNADTGHPYKFFYVHESCCEGGGIMVC